MKQDEHEIENLAQDYFKDSSRPKEKRDALLTAIYKNKEFVIKTVAGALKKYPNVLNKDDLQDLKHDAVLKTFEQAENNYNPAAGHPFINYFSRNLSLNTQTILKKENEKKNEISLDAAMGNDEDADSLVNNLADEREYVKDASVVENQNKQIIKIFNSIDKFFSKQAWQKNKSAVYTYFVLEYLLNLPDSQCSRFIEKYEFLKPQKDTIEFFRKEFAKSRKVPDQNEFAKICGTATTIFSRLRPKMEVFVKSDVLNGEN